MLDNDDVRPLAIKIHFEQITNNARRLKQKRSLICVCVCLFVVVVVVVVVVVIFRQSVFLVVSLCGLA